MIRAGADAAPSHKEIGTRADIIRQAFEVFRADVEAVPAMTLRGGVAVDGYEAPPPYHAALDEPTDAYLERYAFGGVTYLDAASWRHYLPRLIDYALRHVDRRTPGTMAIDGLLWSLRPPDREPPRLGSLTAAQESVIISVLDELAFADDSVHRESAMQVLEEWWLPDALYRHPHPGGGSPRAS